MKASSKFMILMALVVLMLFGASLLLSNATKYREVTDQGQATIIRAQGQARLDSAQAWAVMSGAMLPWGVLGVLGLLGVVGLSLVLRPAPPQSPPHIIERQIIYLPPPGQARRETWQVLTAGQPVAAEMNVIEE